MAGPGSATVIRENLLEQAARASELAGKHRAAVASALADAAGALAESASILLTGAA